VPSEVDDLLEGKRLVDTGFPETLADQVIGRFIAGHLIRVSRKSKSNVDLEQLEGLDEIWALCFRKPKPGWRVFGRFLEKDLFVGLRAHDRHEFGSRFSFSGKASGILSDWEELFGTIPPLRSDKLSDYLSGVYVDVDEPQD